jgi:hypothetical protein
MKPHLPKRTAFTISRSGIAALRKPAALSRYKSKMGGGRNARATSSRYARFLEIPRQFTLENYRLAAGLTAITQRVQKLTTFAGPTLRHIDLGRNRKSSEGCEKRVDDGTSLWKEEENLESIAA